MKYTLGRALARCIYALTALVITVFQSGAVSAQCSTATPTRTTNTKDTCSGKDPSQVIVDYEVWSFKPVVKCVYSGWVSTWFGSGAVDGQAVGQCGAAPEKVRPDCPGLYQGPSNMGCNGANHYFQLATWNQSVAGSGCSATGPYFYSGSAPCEECGGPFCCGQELECSNLDGTWDGAQCACSASPIIVDVDGDGFQLTNAAEGVSFDLWALGSPYRIGWTSAGASDAFLVLDRNTNGVIDDGSELFGNVTEQPAPIRPAKRNGFAALAVFDSNLDGLISSSDSIYSSLRLWVDANHNGASEPAELATLVSRRIAAIGLTYRESQRRDRHGNLFRYRAQVETAPKRPVWAYDVFLVGEQKRATR